MRPALVLLLRLARLVEAVAPAVDHDPDASRALVEPLETAFPELVRRGSEN
jgi:hypothetical protein